MSGTTGSTANGLNQLVTQGGASLAYDARGNMTDDGAGHGYAYTSENRLANASGTEAAHDPLGRLFWTSTGRFFDYDTAGGGGAMVTEMFNGQIARRFVFGPGVDEPLVWYEGPGMSDRRYLHADERGSIVAITDSAGHVIGRNTYDEYGKPGASNMGRFQYTGQKWIPELGLYDYKNRMYWPEEGRFDQFDPIWPRGGSNGYPYVNDDPINFTDPWGLDGNDIVVTACRKGKVLIGGQCFTLEDIRKRLRQIADHSGNGDGGQQGKSPKAPKPKPKPRHPDKGRSQCAGALVGGGFAAVTLLPIEAIWGPMAVGEFGVIGAGVATGAVTGGISLLAAGVFALVYFSDQSHDNASADAIRKNTGAC